MEVNLEYFVAFVFLCMLAIAIFPYVFKRNRWERLLKSLSLSAGYLRLLAVFAAFLIFVFLGVAVFYLLVNFLSGSLLVLK